MMNIINGGAHADNPLDIQEFMILPVGAESFSEALRMGTEIFHALKKQLKDAGHNTAVGDEGGFAPNLAGAEEALAFIEKGVGAAGYKPRRGRRAGASTSPPASSSRTASIIWRARARCSTRKGWSVGSRSLCEKFPIVSVEDGMAEGDWDGWKLLTETLGDEVQLVGDDLFVTNPAILARGIEEGVANSILIKVNQIGTLTETMDAIQLATAAATPRSSRTARARPRIRPSPTSPSPPIAVRSRPDRCRVPTGWRSTISCCGSSRCWVRAPSMPGVRAWPAAELERRSWQHGLIEGLSGWLRGRWLAVVVTAILAYFGYHALHGRYGVLAWLDTSRDLEAARLELAGLTAEREQTAAGRAGVPARSHRS